MFHILPYFTFFHISQFTIFHVLPYFTINLFPPCNLHILYILCRTLCFPSGVLDRAAQRSGDDDVLVPYPLAHHDRLLVLLLGPGHRVGRDREGEHAILFLGGVQRHSEALPRDVHQPHALAG